MNKKFTLVELLVVVAVMGLLLSILLPSLTKARLESYSAVCKSNQAQLTKAVMVYVSENNHTMPPIRTKGNAGRVEWKRLLFPILTQEKVVVGFDRRWGHGAFKCELQKQLDWSNVTEKAEAKSGGIVYNSQLGEDYDTLYKITQVDVPAETLMTGDSKNDATGVKKYFLTASRNRDNISTRHKQGLNVAWVDGHVNWVHENKLKAGKNNSLDHYYLRVKE